MDILYCFELPTGSVAEGIGDICFPVIGSSFQDDVVTVLYILAGGKTQDLCLIQSAVFVILNTFYGSVRSRKMGILDASDKLVHLASVLFCIHKENQPVLEAECSIG